jgi:4-hydroxyphenylacetate 3-monooxygenase
VRNDAVLYFDDVKVPWDRVFVSRNIARCQKQFHATLAHVFQNYQSQIRLMAKMRFLVGIARRIAETNGVVNFPQVRAARLAGGAKHDGGRACPLYGAEGPHAWVFRPG